MLAEHQAATIRRLAYFQGRHVATVADGLAHLRIRMAASATDMGKEAKAVVKTVRDLSHAYKVSRHATVHLVQQVGNKLDSILYKIYGDPTEVLPSESKSAGSGPCGKDVAQQLELQGQLIATLMSQVGQLQEKVQRAVAQAEKTQAEPTATESQEGDSTMEDLEKVPGIKTEPPQHVPSSKSVQTAKAKEVRVVVADQQAHGSKRTQALRAKRVNDVVEDVMEEMESEILQALTPQPRRTSRT